jgi:hypothetical protein
MNPDELSGQIYETALAVLAVGALLTPLTLASVRALVKMRLTAREGWPPRYWWSPAFRLSALFAAWLLVGEYLPGSGWRESSVVQAVGFLVAAALLAWMALRALARSLDALLESGILQRVGGVLGTLRGPTRSHGASYATPLSEPPGGASDEYAGGEASGRRRRSTSEDNGPKGGTPARPDWLDRGDPDENRSEDGGAG